MAQTLRIDNYGTLNIAEITKLTADSIATATTFNVENNQNFTANDYFIIGQRGGEFTEQLLVQSVSTGTITSTAGAIRAHSKFDEVVKLFGNQIKVYRANNVDGSQPDDADFSALGSPTTIDFDQLSTDITDATTTTPSDYWYKFTYRNATTTSETPLSDSKAVRGGDVGNYASIASIRSEAGLQSNRWLTDALIDQKRQAAQAEINSTLSGTYSVPFDKPVNPLIAEITRKLAAGFLLTENYGATSVLNTTNGTSKINEARALLDKLNKKELVLTDASGADTSITTSSGVYFWPDTTTATADAEDGGAERMFRASDIY